MLLAFTFYLQEKSESGKAASLSIANVGGIFVVLLAGIINTGFINNEIMNHIQDLELPASLPLWNIFGLEKRLTSQDR